MSDPSPSVLVPNLSITQQTILALAARSPEAQLVDDLEQITQRMQFDFYHYAGSFSIDDNACIQRTLSNLPTVWREMYSGTDKSRPDPIAQAARLRVIPVAWNESLFGKSDHENFYEIAHTHGIGN